MLRIEIVHGDGTKEDITQSITDIEFYASINAKLDKDVIRAVYDQIRINRARKLSERPLMPSASPGA